MSRVLAKTNLDGINFCNFACMGAYRRTGHIHNGYRVTTINSKRVREHRHIMEQHLGRKLLPSWVVHHKDGDRLNNSLANLIVMDRGTHTRMHLPLKWDLEQAKALRAKGLSFSKIGRELGVTHASITGAFIRRGIRLS